MISKFHLCVMILTLPAPNVVVRSWPWMNGAITAVDPYNGVPNAVRLQSRSNLKTNSVKLIDAGQFSRSQKLKTNLKMFSNILWNRCVSNVPTQPLCSLTTPMGDAEVCIVHTCDSPVPQLKPASTASDASARAKFQPRSDPGELAHLHPMLINGWYI